MNPAQLIQNRSTLTIFRDCIKLASRMVDEKSKAQAIRKLVRKQFQRHKEEFDQDKIKALKMNAVKGISNYIIHLVRVEYNLKEKKNINIHEDHDDEVQEQLAQLHKQQTGKKMQDLK